MRSEDDAKRLESMFNGLLQARIGQGHEVVRDGDTVSYRYGDEYILRQSGNACNTIRIREEENREENDAKSPIYASTEKKTLAYFDTQTNETFHPDDRKEQEELNTEYQALPLTITYQNEPGTVITVGIPINDDSGRPENLPIGDLPMFARARNGLRDIIVQNRGSNKHNQEQNPNKNERLLIEENVDLTRDPITEEESKHGPGSARAYHYSEKKRKEIVDVLDKKRKNWAVTTIKTAAKLPGLGIESLVELGVDVAVDATGKGKTIRDDLKERKRRMNAVVASVIKIDEEIARMEASLAATDQQ